MKSLIAVIFVLLPSLTFAETVYVRKAIVESGVTAADGETVRDVVRKAAQAQGQKILNSGAKAQWVLRPVVGKSDQGPFTVKVERTHNGQAIGATHGSDVKLEEAAKLASTNVIEGQALSSLPEKNTPSASYETVMSTTENREVAAKNDAAVNATIVESKHPNYIKNWLVAVGPVVANSLVGTNGTKFAITLAYSQGLSEHFNVLFIYDASFNSGSVGGTSSILGAVGVKYFLFDRLSDWSPYAMLDLGYGGGNRANDATVSGGGTIGVDVFRTQAATYTVYLRNYTLMTNNGSSLANYPNITQFMFGINF